MKSATLICLLALIPFTAQAEQRERTVCGVIKERAYFTLWSTQAPSRDADSVSAHPLVDTVSFVTGDNRTLRGYRYQAHDSSQQAVETQAYVLVAMGNAMVSDQMIPYLERYARAGVNAYVFDYRGYADSEGRRRIQAIIQDYQELITEFSATYEHAYLYGTSLGGFVIMNAIAHNEQYTRAVIDASPAKLSSFGCPPRLDPVELISSDHVGRVLIITGGRDRVLNDSMTAPLRTRAGELGVDTYHGDAFDHPFMDSPREHERRQTLVKEFLLR